MKIAAYSLVALLVVLLLAFVSLSLLSRRPQETGLVGGQLRSCPQSPNCVCSEHGGQMAYIDPLRFTGPPEIAWQVAVQALQSMGGHIQSQGDAYLWATFTTPIMRYVDDLELRLQPEEGLIHVRSASRVGHSDLGANRQRIEQLRALFRQQQEAAAE